jgi:hypothetical protein
MPVLNPELYNALCREFGEVRITNQGMPMLGYYSRDGSGRTRMIISTKGEYYVINCPYCRERKFRLWIHHRWGIKDSTTGTRNYWLAYCFNEDCLRDEENRLNLIERTIWYHRMAQANRIAVAEGAATNVAEPRDPGKPIPLPGGYVPLDELDFDHPARCYVRARGFKSGALASKWGVGFSPSKFSSHDGRLVIPFHRIVDGKPIVWGWQGRAIGDRVLPKYITAKGFKKSEYLYGLPRVDDGAGPVLVCEGPVDVWRAGGNAVALLGKHASEEQVRLIRRHLHGRPLVVALDGDAREMTDKLVACLRDSRSQSILRRDDAPVVPLYLPEGRDPADCGRKELWAMARRALEDAGS